MLLSQQHNHQHCENTPSIKNGTKVWNSHPIQQINPIKKNKNIQVERKMYLISRWTCSVAPSSKASTINLLAITKHFTNTFLLLCFGFMYTNAYSSFSSFQRSIPTSSEQSKSISYTIFLTTKYRTSFYTRNVSIVPNHQFHLSKNPKPTNIAPDDSKLIPHQKYQNKFIHKSIFLNDCIQMINHELNEQPKPKKIKYLNKLIQRIILIITIIQLINSKLLWTTKKDLNHKYHNKINSKRFDFTKLQK